jgi:hypothetical protein
MKAACILGTASKYYEVSNKKEDQTQSSIEDRNEAMLDELN